MFVFKKTKDMDLYDGKASLDGNLVLASNGVTAVVKTARWAIRCT